MPIFKSHIRAMSAYKPPLEGRDPKSHLLLDFNERTLPLSQNVTQALIDYINEGRLQMYPSYSDISSQIAAYAKVHDEQVMITNGSDQGIDLIFRSSCRDGDEVIIPGPSFAMYHQCARIENLKIVEPQYTRAQGFPLKEVLAAISEKTKLIVVSNPNNPSGTILSREGIIQIAEAAPQAAVLVDECYFEYCGATVSDLVDTHKNLVITRTFSKTWGMPALRIGYIISAAENIAALLNVRGPYDINQLAVVALRAALQDQSNVKNYIDEVMKKSKPKFEAFLENSNIPYWPSSANFIWIFPERAEYFEEKLREASILVRPKLDSEGNTGLRITLGTLEQVEKMISVIQNAMASSS